MNPQLHCCNATLPQGAYGLKLTKFKFALQPSERELDYEEEVGAGLALHPEHHLLNAPALLDDLAT